MASLAPVMGLAGPAGEAGRSHRGSGEVVVRGAAGAPSSGLLLHRKATMLLHVQRLPPQGRALPQHRLHPGIRGEELGSYVAVIVQLLDELVLVGRQGQDRRKQLVTIRKELVAPGPRSDPMPR